MKVANWKKLEAGAVFYTEQTGIGIKFGPTTAITFGNRDFKKLSDIIKHNTEVLHYDEIDIAECVVKMVDALNKAYKEAHKKTAKTYHRNGKQKPPKRSPKNGK